MISARSSALAPPPGSQVNTPRTAMVNAIRAPRAAAMMTIRVRKRGSEMWLAGQFSDLRRSLRNDSSRLLESNPPSDDGRESHAHGATMMISAQLDVFPAVAESPNTCSRIVSSGASGGIGYVKLLGSSDHGKNHHALPKSM